jgi:hypothetical protein
MLFPRGPTGCTCEGTDGPKHIEPARLQRSYKPTNSVKILDLNEQDDIHTAEEMFLWQYSQGWLMTPERLWGAASELKVDLKKIDMKNGKYLG